MEKFTIASLVLVLLVMTIFDGTEAARRGLLDYPLVRLYNDENCNIEDRQAKICNDPRICLEDFMRCLCCDFHKYETPWSPTIP